MYLAKDFIETTEGLIFAVVENGVEQGKVLCFLRYIFLDAQWNKVNTEQANLFLANNHPHYFYYSVIKQANLHAVSLNRVIKHHQPRSRLNFLLANTTRDEVESDLFSLCSLFKKNGLNLAEIGVTGSILIAVQKQSSDIDLVFYSRETFHLARKITQKLIQQDDCTELKEKDWRESYHRRQCDLSYSEYLWHEQRKFNKALINQRKFDLSFVADTIKNSGQQQYNKLQSIVIETKVIDDTYAFDYPSELFICHQQIQSILSYTATYTGQAKTGEWIETSGLLEESSDGSRHIVVGSSREARGEYIKVIHEAGSERKK